MNLTEAGRKLRAMYDAAAYREKACSTFLFGIKYADELRGLTNQAIVRASGLRQQSYPTNVARGRQLAKYVQLRPGTR